MNLAKPGRLHPGDRVAIVSPSGGGPAAFPSCYALGRHTLEERLGLEIIEMPNALADANWLARHPEARAEDLHAAFTDPTVRAIIASIGGEDSIRLIPHFDLRVITQNPKIFLGFSDSTTIHFACMKAGVGSFYGPNVIPNLAVRAEPFDYALRSLRQILFETDAPGAIEPNHCGWTEQLFDFVLAESEGARGFLHPSNGPRLLQGRGTARGPLIGGCAEVLEMLKETAWWPPRETWRGAILFYETYAVSTPQQLTAWLRNFAAQGILQLLNGIIFGRPGGIPPAQHEDYDAVWTLVLGENGLSELPVMTQMDFGHTDPVFTLPYGRVAEIDCEALTFSLTESGVASNADGIEPSLRDAARPACDEVPAAFERETSIALPQR